MIVVDASVAVLWWLPQPRATAAMTVLSSHTVLIAPSLIQLEVASALLRALRRSEMDRDTVARVVSYLLPSSVGFDDRHGDVDAALALAQQFGGSVHDALYVALARRLDAPLVTDDARMRSVALSAGVQARLLGDEPFP